MMRRLLIGMIRGYQLLLSPVIPPCCRFYPSCSQYAIESIRKKGAWVGIYYSARRLMKCHPFHPGGYDPA